jgi:hypothetical protein
LEARTLFDWVTEQRPGVYQEGQLRTLQRRVALWRVAYTTPLLTLAQVQRPGEVRQTDGVWRSHLGVTIGGTPLPHVLIHSVLPYSNWAWGRVAQSESFLAHQLGLQRALAQLGHVPRVHQTDNSSAATHRLGGAARGQVGGERGFNAEYQAVVDHFGVAPRTIHGHSPNEHGAVEAGNGALQRALAQHLLLRGQRDFASVVAYEAFRARICGQRNARRQARLGEELAAMRPLVVAPLPDRRELRVRVAAGGLIRVLAPTYSVPSGLAGKLVTAHVRERCCEISKGSKQGARRNVCAG